MKYRLAVMAFGIGVLVTGVTGWLLMPHLMLQERQSPFGVEETVEKIKEAAVAEGWVVQSVTPLNNSIKKHGGGDLPAIRLINLCQPHHAHKILEADKSKVVAVMMPCTIAVYQQSDGQTYIGTMNAGLLGRMFGGVVAEVMGDIVAKEQQGFIAFANP